MSRLRRLRLCKFGPWCERPSKSCFFIHAGDPQYEEALRLDPAFVPVKPIQPSPTQRSSDRGRRGHRQAHDRSRDRSPRRDDYRRRQDRPRGRSISRDRSSSPSPPQIRGFELPSPPRSSRSESRQVKPSPSSGGPALPDEKPASSRSWETTPIYLNPSGVPRSSTFSKYPYSSILLTVDPKLSWDSALMRSGLDRLKKAENSFKSRSHALEEASPDDKLDVSSSITWISSIALKVSGHFCDVYEGTHVVRGKVALKRPRLGGLAYNEISRRFEREALTWRKLRHPNILEFIGTLRRDGHLYLVSPFITNGTLAEYVLLRPEVNRIKLLFETAGAVHYLHRCGVVHGDIKGGNILISDNVQALLCDFGLTKTTDSRTSTAMKGAGTVRWQSPELWEDKPRTFQSDVYAFGMTIAEVLKGEAPFAHINNNLAVMRAVITRNERPSKTPATSPTGISYAVAWSIADACWVSKPEDRIPIFDALTRLQRDRSLGT